ncbi:hypothetical protein [Hafnia alvei]|uniref:hypothetical protein n=1 Tax=Hafnia alvei TaxID=569 RepID=UPI00345C7A78
MAKIRYRQRTHDAAPGDVKNVDDPCAKVLVLLGKAEYISARRPGGQKKKNVNAEAG